ncbi:MAG TPA: hypothetical protein VFX78_00890 [Candidatus Eisenbacteria bacterium]|jgi:hypothetical protein|nr:hypothetical protein [Candidatus Eisenbacteria bacterium]
MNPCRSAFLALFVVAMGASPALAGVGFQGGLSLSPDDFIAGVHWKGNPLADQLYLVPSVEVGFGDATMIAGNADLHYQFKTKSKLAPYAGGGLTVNWFDSDGGSETDVGGSFLGGIALSPKIYFETKVGLGDVPDWKFLLGWHAH